MKSSFASACRGDLAQLQSTPPLPCRLEAEKLLLLRRCRCQLALCELFGAQRVYVGAACPKLSTQDTLRRAAVGANVVALPGVGALRSLYALSLSSCEFSTSQAVFGVSSKRGSFLSAFCIILLI